MLKIKITELGGCFQVEYGLNELTELFYLSKNKLPEFLCAVKTLTQDNWDEWHTEGDGVEGKMFLYPPIP